MAESINRNHAYDLSTETIHRFVDASISASAVAEDVRADKDCNLIMDVSRLTPVKGLTFPHLELLATLIATRLFDQVSPLLQVNFPPLLWSNSPCSLSWISLNN
ncbi:hypothetical protein AB6A40_005077 [Gnathostoma spinigerum]|uniref:Uncharacterized protein n=1 Tax=Gnathostoma spinigerum TaxID=75299 RepID=A0ABD6EEE6_9BILA